jgi:GNAT superfamily N-acetyltransferase
LGIENVAALPEFRGRGLTTALIQETIRDAARHECKLAQITMFIGNHAALSVYTRSGFRVTEEKRCADLEAVLQTPGFVRMMREIPVK